MIWQPGNAYAVQGGGVTTFTAGALITFTALPGQMGWVFRYLAGGTFEIGGPSLTAGNGLPLPSAIQIQYVNCAGNIYGIAGGSNSTVTWMRTFSEGNPGDVG